MTDFKSPPQPWKQGVQEDYIALTLEVQLCGDTTGRVWSFHDFKTPEDAEVALKLPQGGAPQVAYALLTEAYRREVFVIALTELGQNPKTLAEYQNGSSEVREALEARLALAAQEVMKRTLTKMGTGAAKEILAMLQGVG